MEILAWLVITTFILAGLVGVLVLTDWFVKVSAINPLLWDNVFTTFLWAFYVSVGITVLFGFGTLFGWAIETVGVFGG